MPTRKISVVVAPRIDQRILILRGERVILDTDLAELYGVPTKRLNEQVKRNPVRFPADFVFRLNAAEVETLNRSQIATGSQKHRDPRLPPYAFTEHGAIQASNVLNSPRAAEMSVLVVRAFVRMREVIAQNKEITQKLARLEGRIDGIEDDMLDIVQAVRQLMDAAASPPRDTKPKRRIGFV